MRIVIAGSITASLLAPTSSAKTAERDVVGS